MAPLLRRKAPEFDETTPVLDFEPFSSRRAIEWRYILWPAWAWRVSAPRIKERQTNFLQRAVLGLCMAGCRQPEGISEQLAIDENLVELVLGQLKRMGFLGERRAPTREGEKQLEEGTDLAAENIATGWVYQDPWDRELWPHFATDQPLREIRWRGNAPEIDRGTPGAPDWTGAFAVWPSRHEFDLGQPDAREVLDAAQRHRRRERRQEWGTEAPDGSDDEGGAPDGIGSAIPDRVRRRIRVVDERPEPVWLFSCVYVPKEDYLRDEKWQARSPFGAGDSPGFRTKIERRTEEYDPLEEHVMDSLIDSAEEKIEEFGLMLELIDEKARNRLHRRLGEEVEQLEVFDVLLKMTRGWGEIEESGSDRWNDKAESLLVKCQQALEKTSYLMNERWEASVKIRRMEAKKGGADGARGELLNRMAEKCGFVTPIPHGMRVQSPGQVDRARSLRAKVTRMLLAADHPSHPLRQFGEKQPDLLERIDTLADRRNQSAHWDPDEESLVHEELEESLETVYRTVELLFEPINAT